MNDSQPPASPRVELLDGEAQHRAAPQTFSIPRRVVRESLRPGDLVKLLFKVDPTVDAIDVERMWVQVIEATDSGYLGRLDNEPQILTNLKPGDAVAFGPEHVVAREAEPGDPLYNDPSLIAVVSRRVWDADAWPARLERHPIPDDQYSGWFVLAGDEPDDHRASPDNFLPMRQLELFERFRVLDSGMEGAVGTVMVWSEPDLEYRPADSN